MESVCIAGSEPLPGYRLLSRMGRGGFGEVWKCEAPGGLHKAIKFVAACPDLLGNGDAMRQEHAALARLRAIRHPFLLSVERVELVPGGLVVVMELADENLRDVFETFRAAGEPGIPRDLLLGYFAEIAEALDLLNGQHQLMHLDVKPDNVFLIADHAKLGDFGLVAALQQEGGSNFRDSGLTPAYAAPELWLGKASRQSDQYSLAVTYYELRTGGFVFDGGNTRQLMLQHATQPPSLGLLPPQERRAVERALAKSPGQRFASCRDFVHALRTGEEPAGGQQVKRTWRPALVTTAPLEQVAGLIARGRGAPGTGKAPEPVVVVRRRYVSHQLRGMLRMQLDEFLKVWDGELVSGTSDRVLFRIGLPPGFSARYPAATPTLAVDVRLNLPRLGTGALSAVEAEVRPVASGVAELLMARQVGPMVLDSLSKDLELTEERRGSERVEWTAPLLAWPAEGKLREPIHCHGKDVSLGGVRFVSPVEPPGQLLRVRLGAEEESIVDVVARVVRAQACPAGFDVGAQFCEVPLSPSAVLALGRRP